MIASSQDCFIFCPRMGRSRLLSRNGAPSANNGARRGEFHQNPCRYASCLSADREKPDMPRRILIYATVNWPSAARYAHGFVASGCQVFALSPARAPVQSSRYVSGTAIYSALSPMDSLRAALGRFTPDLVVSCDERALMHLLALHAGEKSGASPVADLIARSVGVPANYDRVLSRNEFLAEMAVEGVRVPPTLPVTSPDALEDALDAIGLPAVLKADGSWGGEGVAVVRTHAEAHAAYRRLALAPSRLRSAARTLRRRDLHFLLAALNPSAASVCLQRFVAGRTAASAFAAHQGRIVGAFYYDALVAQSELGPPSVIRRLDCPEMEKATRIAAQRFGLSGLHGLDFIRDESGAAHLIEINPRATQGGTLPFGAGRDLPAALAATLSAEPVGRREAIENDVVAFFPREWQRDPSSPWLKAGHHDVPWDDPALLHAAFG
jgi:hypothetical protein